MMYGKFSVALKQYSGSGNDYRMDIYVPLIILKGWDSMKSEQTHQWLCGGTICEVILYDHLPGKGLKACQNYLAS